MCWQQHLSPWRPPVGLLSGCIIFKSSHFHSCEGRAPADSMTTWDFMTTWAGTRIVHSAMAASYRHHCNINFIWWRHQMESFPCYWPFVRGIHRSPMNSPHKGQWSGALRFHLIRAWINGLVNNREAGDLRRHRAYYNVTVMAGRGGGLLGQPYMQVQITGMQVKG